MQTSLIKWRLPNSSITSGYVYICVLLNPARKPNLLPQISSTETQIGTVQLAVPVVLLLGRIHSLTEAGGWRSH